ncbi:putative transcription factor C2H2 family [Helianthus annuus]|nr:putative transcription factor C2H2 family [Helianthus annuus]KAJ0602310.1 putative transcription factor C2H2 family [Helianthus annuus]KAJ0769268.1 putative transcription factor C2H2 family [Helianthus annuus]
MTSDSPIKGQMPDNEQDSSEAYALSGKIMLASIITLFIIVFFMVLLHLYARWYLTRLHRNNDTRPPTRHNRSTRILYYINNNGPLASGSSGLNASILKSLPVFVYSTETEAKTNVVECAVCLSEFENGESGRVLPNCKHCFHTECIDMWFYNHSTCPLCRSPVEPVAEPGPSAELIETTTSEERRKRVDVRIDVPVNEPVTENEVKLTSPGSRLLSLRRMVNMSRVSPVVSPSSGGAVGPSCVVVGTELDAESGRQESDHESSRQG